jgi:hypothetical protein
MKTTTRVILRSVAVTPLRVAMVYAGFIALIFVDWSPLPDGTADAVGYAIQFAASYLLAWWVLHGRSTRWSDGLVVAFTFITVGTMLEILVAVILRGPSPELFANMFAWQSGLLYIVYLLGVMVATWQVKGKREKLEVGI